MQGLFTKMERINPG
jgi:hypothetical protein